MVWGVWRRMEGRPCIMSGTLVWGVWRRMEGRPCISDTLVWVWSKQGGGAPHGGQALHQLHICVGCGWVCSGDIVGAKQRGGLSHVSRHNWLWSLARSPHPSFAYHTPTPSFMHGGCNRDIVHPSSLPPSLFPPPKPACTVWTGIVHPVSLFPPPHLSPIHTPAWWRQSAARPRAP